MISFHNMQRQALIPSRVLQKEKYNKNWKYKAGKLVVM